MKSLFVIVHVYMCVLIQSNEINIQTLVSKHKSEVIHKS
jgi:thiosulfate reductase cytochrome b subunit